MWQKIRTLFRHWLAPGRKSALSDPALDRLAAHVAACEKLHSGEIRICVESRLPDHFLLQPHAMARLVRQRAEAEFARLRVWDTAHNNGVLIYLLLAEHAIEIVSDRGLNDLVGPQTWNNIIERLALALRQHRFEDGLKAAVDEVSALLAQHFALQAGARNPNELPDRPVAD